LARTAHVEREDRRHRDADNEVAEVVEVVEAPEETHEKADVEMRDAEPAGGVAEVVVGESAEDNEARRERIREAMKKREDEEVLPTAEEEEESEEESEYEEESDYDDEADMRRPPPPLFVPKAARETIAEKERLEKELEEQEVQKLKQLEERKSESRQLLIEAIKKEKEEAKAEEASDADLPDDGQEDEENVEEYEQWKLRELRRIKREKEEREAVRKQEEEVAKRRGMTDDEIARMDRELLKPKEKSKMKFLQKYYHRGAFFGDDALLTRDYTPATGEDKIDKTVLPLVMQVKNFGRAGRTKWTHLVAEDTTKFDAGWAAKDGANRTYVNKMGGMGPVDDPKRKYKRKMDQPPQN
jgi:microfibrillar-associated protein 1